MKLLLCRTIILYLCVLFAMRLMGKRQLGELQPEELVSTILISNLASISIESEDVPITASLIPLFLIAALELLGSVVSFRSQKFFNFLSGRPKTVILDGKIDQNALRMLRLTTADLMEALRGKDIFDPRRVSYAVIETNGTLSAALRPEQEAATLSDLQLKVQQTQATIPFTAYRQRDRGLFSAEKRRPSAGRKAMKRIYACILIVAALLGVSLYSSGRVQGFAQDISADLDCALEAVRQKDFPTARQALAEGAELCDTMRETMSHLLRTADYTELEAALRAADGYLEQQAAEEALGELRRAQVEVERLEWLARRLV